MKCLSKQKILIVNHGYNAPFLDVANQYASLFDTDHFEVTSLFFKGAEIKDKNVKIVGNKKIYLNYTSRKLRGLKIKPIISLIRILRQNNFSMIIAHRYKAIYLVALASFFFPRCRLIGIAHAYKVFSRLSRKLLVKIVGGKLVLLGVSQSIQKDILEDLSSVGFSKVFSLPNCVNIDDLKNVFYSRDKAREQLGIGSDTFLIASAGRLHHDKDQETLIRAFTQFSNKMPQAKLFIFGSGHLEAKLKSLIRELNMDDRIRLVGFVKNLSKYYTLIVILVIVT